jgi:23S rRNA (pseudouridine1915-N3)-methyltransferase
MNIHIYWIGKTGNGFVKDGIKLYEKRLNHYCKLTVHEIQDVKNKARLDAELLKKKEAELILSKIPEKTYLVLLDENGSQLSSRNMADKLEQIQQHYTGDLSFLIGGAFGVDEQLKNRANMILSLSKMTFSHQFIRVMLYEQLYRAFTIIKGEKYHND